MKRLVVSLPVLLLVLLFTPLLALFPLAAPISPASFPAETTFLPGGTGGPAPPPLPGDCGGGGTPIDYNHPVCCVHGYVYLNGSPVLSATVQVSYGGSSVTVYTANASGSARPYFSVGLNGDPLNVQPGALVSVTAIAGGQSKTQSFTARAGAQQVDVVLPYNVVDAAWTRADIPKRISHAMVYDAARQRIMLTGGNDRGRRYADTWARENNAWLQLPPSPFPPARDDHALAYDAARRRVILFGGEGDAGELNDTWEWDGGTWIALSPANAPSAREFHTLAYDAARQETILFGGGDNVVRLNDTWIWDGNNWTRQSPSVSPPARDDHAMVYDAARQRVTLFGGRGDEDYLADTWVWNGAAWQRKQPALSPSPRFEHAMAYDAARQRVVLFGGAHPGLDYFNDTWEWDGYNWTQLHPANSPPGRSEHAMAYDAGRQKIVLFGGWGAGGPLADTWEWDGVNWTQVSDAAAVSPRSAAALAYEGAGQAILFGGKDNGAVYSATFRLNGGYWQELRPAHIPPARYGHRLVGNSAGNQFLSFGGLNAAGDYLNDTWLWTGGDWETATPAGDPPPRVNYGLSYNSQQGRWLLFGGQNAGGYLNDTWVFSNSVWTQLYPAASPTARAGFSLDFDPARGKAVLMGGQNNNGYLQDVWEWDGGNWTQIAYSGGPEPRAGHSGAYDSARGVTVIAGGVNSGGVLSDTWEWNGLAWRPRITALSYPAMYNAPMIYNAADDYLLAAGGERGGGAVEGFYLHRVLGAPADAPPIATINLITPRDARQGEDTILFAGSGADADSSDVISAWRWTYSNTVISAQPVFSAAASEFALGRQSVRFEVQDNEGNWSAPVEQSLYIRDQNGGAGGQTWALLIYAAADNNLDAWMGDYSDPPGMLYRLKNAGPQAKVQVGILYDGPEAGDSNRITFTDSGDWRAETLGEVRMDEMETLRDFIAWGYNTFDADYYLVALANHANGVVGFAQDNTTDNSGRAFLTPLEIRSALQNATGNGSQKIDLLFYDGCSFGLFEDAAIAEGLADFIAASPNTGWGVFKYEAYRRRAGQAGAPRALAQALADEYAAAASAGGRPYTISVFDMARFNALNNAVSALGTRLNEYAAADNRRVIQLQQLRTGMQKYDSGGQTPLVPDNQDSYVDLIDMAQTFGASLTDTAVISAANAVIESAQGNNPFIAYRRAESGSFIKQGQLYTVDLNKARGAGIFYPPGYSADANTAYWNYVHHKLFNITPASGWTDFLTTGIPPLSASDPAPMSNDFLIAPLYPVELQRVYLPLLMR